ncbi:cAMP-regulated phosphoprotein 21-like isoform X2 [Centruroides vittatus]|uniref:cAMP-regulated phosphoprotein 21-like isoform X2 n=1 Tax=Centruroides vittatus TaxID=120091 RepID=UPI00350F2B64
MAKSEIPNIVVQSGSGNNSSGSGNSDMENNANRSQIRKQDDEIDEACSVPSPITIHIENNTENNCIENGENDNEVDDVSLDYTENKNHKNHILKQRIQQKFSREERGEVKEKGQKFGTRSTRLKLLVRSQAVQDDTSPPPELDNVVANSNMLSVNNNPLYPQTHSRSSSKHSHLGKQNSSQSSLDGSSPSLSRDSSTEAYTDATGIDLQQFIIDTLHKNHKDRIMLMKLEQEFITFIRDDSRLSYKFPQMSSYNRMLVHRTAAFFGLEHNVDHSGTAIIVNKCKNTRIPDFKFSDHIRDDLVQDEPKKSILKRDNSSFEDGREKMSDKQFSDSRRSKSFEEREEEYQKAKARIFNRGEQNFIQSESIVILSHNQEDSLENECHVWVKNENDNLKHSAQNSNFADNDIIENEEKLLDSSGKSNDSLHPNCVSKPPMMKSHSFGGISVLISEASSMKMNNTISKAESFNVSSSSHSSNETPGENNSSSSPSLMVSSESGKLSNNSISEISDKLNSSVLPIIPSFPFVGPEGQASLQQVPSQPSEWTEMNKDNCVNSVIGSSIPNVQNETSSEITENSSGTSYVKINESSEKKPVSNNTSPAVMFTPFQQILNPSFQIVTPNQISTNTASGQLYQQQYIPTLVYIPYISTQNQLMQQNLLTQKNQEQRQKQLENSSSNAGDIISQVTNLNINSQSPPSTNLNICSDDSGNSSSQGYPVSVLKTKNIIGQGNSVEQGAPNTFPIPCLQPASSGIAPGNSTSGINGSAVSQKNTGDNSQATGQSETNASCLSNCNAVLLPQTGNTISMPFYSYASGFQPSVVTSTSGLYQYPTMAVPGANPSNSSHVQQNSSLIPSTHLPQPVSNNSSNLSSYMLTGTTISHSTNIPNSPYNSFRPQTPPMQNVAVQSHPVAPQPSFNYALYQPLHSQHSTSVKPPNAVPSNQTFIRSFPTIRQNIPLVGNLTNSAPMPPPNRFSTPPLVNKNQGNFASNKCETRGKQGTNICQNSPKVNRNPQLQLGTLLSSTSNLGSVYCRGYRPALQDIQFIGHPLQHTFNTLIMSQQQHNGTRHSHTRQSKARKQREKAASNNANRGISSNNNMQDSKSGNVLQVEGLPFGMKKTDMERYLEPVINFGGKIQFILADGKNCGGNDIVIGSKHQVLAVFESSTIAQSALLNIKTNKFQLRPLCRKDRNSCSKKL